MMTVFNSQMLLTLCLFSRYLDPVRTQVERLGQTPPFSFLLVQTAKNTKLMTETTSIVPVCPGASRTTQKVKMVKTCNTYHRRVLAGVLYTF